MAAHARQEHPDAPCSLGLEVDADLGQGAEPRALGHAEAPGRWPGQKTRALPEGGSVVGLAADPRRAEERRVAPAVRASCVFRPGKGAGNGAGNGAGKGAGRGGEEEEDAGEYDEEDEEDKEKEEEEGGREG